MSARGGRGRRAYRRDPESRRDAAAEVDDELAFHLERAAEELRGEGWTEADARAEAERRFGDLAATRRICTDENARARAGRRRERMMEAFVQDLKYAWRTTRRSPTYAAVVVATLAVGIALNTLVFSFLNPYLVRPLPYADAERLVAIGGVDLLEGWDMGRFSAAQVADLAERTRAFSALGHYYYGSTNLSGEGPAEQAAMARMSGGLFPMLGVEPLHGRFLGPDDVRPGAPATAVLSHGLWTRRYGGDPDLVGSTIRLDGTVHTVVGIMPPSFNFPYNAMDLWLPLADEGAASDRALQNSLVIGRLAEGWTREAAEAEVSGIQAELARSLPDTDGRYESVAVKPLREALNFAWDMLRPAFLILLAGVTLVLVIACVNVASLTLARASSRSREVALRTAVGAGRNRILRQLLAESLLLALLGGALGIGFATLGTRAVAGILPNELFRVGEVSVDGRVLLFSVLVTLATPLVFGLAPAWSAARTGLAAVIRTSSGAVGEGRQRARMRRGLVVVQVTLAVVLVSMTGRMVRSFTNALDTDLGFDAERALVATLTPSQSDYPDAEALGAYYRDVEERLASLPGVTGVGTVSHLPLNHETIPVRFTTPDATGVPLDERPSAYTSRAGDGYFAAMDIEVLAGRPLRSDDLEAGGVAVSRALADRLWPSGDAVGRSVVYGSDTELRGTIVAVVADVRYDGLAGSPRPHVYRPLDGTSTRRRFVVIRTAPGTAPSTLFPAVREVFREADPDLPLTLRPMPDIVRESTGVWAIGSGFLGGFGLVAVALAALGIYGLVTVQVQQRLPELGLRLALGADGRRLQAGVVGQGLRLASVGLGLGLLLSVAAGAAVAGFMLGVGAADLPSLGIAFGVFTIVATLASWIPARRAARVDPVRVLRAE